MLNFTGWRQQALARTQKTGRKSSYLIRIEQDPWSIQLKRSLGLGTFTFVFSRSQANPATDEIVPGFFPSRLFQQCNSSNLHWSSCRWCCQLFLVLTAQPWRSISVVSEHYTSCYCMGTKYLLRCCEPELILIKHPGSRGFFLYLWNPPLSQSLSSLLSIPPFSLLFLVTI